MIVTVELGRKHRGKGKEGDVQQRSLAELVTYTLLYVVYILTTRPSQCTISFLINGKLAGFGVSN